MSKLMLAPASSLSKGFSVSSGGSSNQATYALSQTLIQLGKIILLILLISLFILSFVVWVWVASFRSGWRFWTWVENRDSQQISVGILYGISVLVISPFFLFVDWSQKQFERVLPDWMQLPGQFPLRQLFEERLGIKLGEEFPFFIESGKDSQEASDS
jgi:hypothetical protein